MRDLASGEFLSQQRNVVLVGGSGTGKSVLTKHVVGLLKPDRGEVWVLGERVDLMTDDQLDRKRTHVGYLFQGGALFSFSLPLSRVHGRETVHG